MKQFGLALILISYALLLGARTEYLLYAEAHETLPRYIGESAKVSGVINDDPDVRDSSVHLSIRVSTINGAPASGTLLASVPFGSAVSFGDTVTLEGNIAAPQSFITDTGRIFDYQNYLRVRGISALMQSAKLSEDSPGGWSVRGSLFALKHSFEGSLDRIFPQPQNALLQGILLGERRGIPQELNDAFIKSGLVHVVVLSGYNISIVSEGVFRTLVFLPAFSRFTMGGVVMTLFALMVGAGSTTIRALIMALIALLARYLNRRVLAMRSLILAGAFMALSNPLVLLYDTSFILSMLATFGLITLAPAIEAHLPRILARAPNTRSIIASTLAVQFFVLPALLYETGVLSLVSVPANALALPVIPFAMLAGFIAGLLGFIAPILALAPALISNALLSWVLAVARMSAGMPLGALVIPPFSGWFVLLLYIPLTAGATFVYWRTAPHTPTN